MSLTETVHGRQERQTTPPPGPFGFYFSDSMMPPLDTPFEPAPAPPPGPALLDDTEFNMLDSFFTSMNSNQPDNNDFWFNFGDQMNGDSGFGFEWPELPPTFEGSTTSLPSQHLTRDGVISDKGPSLSSDLVAAASMLYQNGNDYSSSSAFSNQIFTNNGPVDLNPGKANPRHPGYSPSNGGPAQPQQQDHGDKEVPYVPTGVYANKMIFDSDPRPADDSLLGKAGYLRWGSDSGFDDQAGYRGPPNQQTPEERTKVLLSALDCLEPQSSGAPSRASSPPPRQQFGNGNVESEWPEASRLVGGSEFSMGDPSRPVKRHKRISDDDDLSPTSGGLINHARSRTTKDRRFSSSNDGPNNSARRKSTAAGIKAARENLTEEQKRANHILSEQKRRNLIKQGFDDLCTIVPQLRGGGYSKSTMLGQAAHWLEELLQGNELLKAQLADLKAQQGS